MGEWGGGGEMKRDVKNDLTDDKSVRKRGVNVVVDGKQYLHSH